MSNTISKSALLKQLDKDAQRTIHDAVKFYLIDLSCEIEDGRFDTDGWISVKDRTPEVNDGEWAAFIIPSRFGAKTVSTIAARYTAGKWSNNEVIRATYWMPLPEPPKEV